MNHAEVMLTQLNTLVWLSVMAGLLGMGLYLNVGLKCLPWRRITVAFKILRQASSTTNKEQISPFQGLMIALSAAISSGGISGVAVAIALGGPGAVFWMWIIALLSMVTQYAETALAVEYRETNEQGDYKGGPMYTIKNGLDKKWWWLASLFAWSGILATLGTGNMIQANIIAGALAENFNIPDWKTAIILTCLFSVMILAGLNQFAKFVAYLMPVLVVAYLGVALWVICHHLPQLPGAIGLIGKSAFTSTAAVSGFTGATIWLAMRSGLEQGVFFNDAGLGRGAIAHATVNTRSSVQQGLIAMLGTVINLFIIGTATALVIVVTGVWSSGKTGLALSVLAFSEDFHGSVYFITLSLSLFAFMAILAWNFYGERCVIFLFGKKAILLYRLIWLVVLPVGATHKVTMVWQFASIFNACMAIPNLIAILLLAPVLFRITSNYVRIED
jgi:AGCS family alanine or glycine:cation symporter